MKVISYREHTPHSATGDAHIAHGSCSVRCSNPSGQGPLSDWTPDLSKLMITEQGSSGTHDTFTHLDLTEYTPSDFLSHGACTSTTTAGASGKARVATSFSSSRSFTHSTNGCGECGGHCTAGDGEEAAEAEQDDPATRCCSICYEEHGAGDMARLPDCEHSFCRGCLVEHVRAKMSELIFPIYCPLCACDYARLEEMKTEIDQRTLDDLKDVFPTHEYEKFEILQLSRHAMSLQCPDCKHEMMIAREDLHNVLVTCPVPTCGAIWCRACNSSVSSCTKFHKCHRDVKFRLLMMKQRWRYCPGCRTPIQKGSGCSHMTCSVPGCGTHFCYRCGTTIWRTGQRGSSYSAAKWHNRWCRVVVPWGRLCPTM